MWAPRGRRARRAQRRSSVCDEARGAVRAAVRGHVPFVPPARAPLPFPAPAVSALALARLAESFQWGGWARWVALGTFVAPRAGVVRGTCRGCSFLTKSHWR